MSRLQQGISKLNSLGSHGSSSGGLSRLSSPSFGSSSGGSKFEELKRQIHAKLVERLDLSRVKDLAGDTMRRDIRKAIEHLCDTEDTLLNRSESATCELHALLNDTVHKVEAGALLVEEVGLTLARSAGAVRQVTEILSAMGADPGPTANTAQHADAGAD